jgi:predicted DNA-binding protein YlxM (UPF0122 family)
MYKELDDKEYLNQRYIDEKWSLQKIADEIGCDKSSVYRACKKHGITRRTRTSKYPQLNDKAWLKKKYVDERKSCKAIGDIVGCWPGTVQGHLVNYGIERRSKNTGTGPNANHWQGGRPIFQGYQYVYAPDHPRATKTRPYVQEHRLVMEEQIGRHLESHEVVHHKDGNKLNNDASNLVIKSRAKHLSDHFKASHEVLKLREENDNLRKRIAELETRLAECERAAR